MKLYSFLASMTFISMILVSCSNDDIKDNDKDPNPGGQVNEETVSGNVDGVWKANSIIKVSGHIIVPEGKSLVIEEGVQVIFDDNGVGVNHVPIEFTVNGNLFARELLIIRF